MIILGQSFIIFLAITLQMLVLGYSINQMIGIWENTQNLSENIYIKSFFALAMGMAIDTTILFVLGIMGWFTPIITIGTLCLITLLAAFTLKRQPLHFHQSDLIAYAGIIIFYLIVFLYAITPPGHSDDTSFHLPIAKFYIQHKQILLNPYLRFPLIPQNMNLIFALGFMTGHSQISAEIIAQSLATLPVFVCGLGLIGTLLYSTWARWPGFIACFLLLILPPVQKRLGFAYIDNGLMLYCWATLLAVGFSITRSSAHKYSYSRWILIAGIMAGMAMGTKYFGLALTFFPALWLLIIRRDWRAMLIYTSIAFLFGSWWYIRSWYISGDPFHPIGGNLFGHFLWNSQDLTFQIAEQATYGVPKKLSAIGSAIIRAHVEPFFLIPLCILYWRRLTPEIPIILFATIGYFFFWFYTTQVDRYLAPIIASAIFLILWSLWQRGQTITHFLSAFFRLKPLHHHMIVACLCIIPLSVIAVRRYLKSHAEFSHWDAILQQRTGYNLMQTANKLIPIYGERMLNAGFAEAIYYYDGTAIGDIFGLGRYSQMTACTLEGCSMLAPQKIKKIMYYHRTNMLVVNLNVFNIDLDSYQKSFTVQKLNAEGVLLTLKVL